MALSPSEDGRTGTGLGAAIREPDAEAVLRAVRPRVVRPTFVGREAELQVLEQEIERAVAGEGRVVLLEGDEGIGKTSLALELSRLARGRACTVLWGQCHEAGGTPAYWPWVQILRRYVEAAAPETLRDDLGESAAAVRWITPGLGGRCPGLPADAGQLTRFHVVDGVTQFVKRVAARRPLVLVLDDLHRIDGDSLHLFRFLATDCADAPLLVLGAYRDGSAYQPSAGDLARVAAQPLTTVLRLGGFEVADVRRYVEAATTVRPSEALAQAIHAKTEGHPLFVAEVARLLATEGRLTEDARNGEFRLPIPATRRQAIANRLACLSTGCRRLLSVAAVIGYDFTAELVADVAGEGAASVRGALAEAMAEQVMTASNHEPGAFRFVHVLVRDVLYEDLAPGERSTLHARVAEALVTRAPGGSATALGTDPPLTAIAHHSLEGATGPDDLRRALGWVIAAGDRAAAMMAHEEAGRHYDVALRVAERARLATPTRMNELLLKLAECRWRAGDMNGARTAGQRALMLAKESAEPAAIAVAALTFAGRLPGFGAIVSDVEVVSELEQALALLPSSAIALRAQVMARLAEELAYSTRRSPEPSLADQAIELARGLGDPTVLAAVLRTTHWSIWTPDAVERRRQLASEIVALAERTGDRVLALDGELLRLWSALEHGETDVAWGQLAVCTCLAGELRLPHYAWVTAAARACLHITTGFLDEAQRLAEQAAEAGGSTGNPTVALVVGAQRIHVQGLRGRFDDVATRIRDLLTSVPVLGSFMECSLMTTFARAGQHDRVRVELAAFAAGDFTRIPRNPGWLMNMVFLADACTAIGDAEVAPHLYRHLIPFTSYNVVLPPAFVLAPVSHYVGDLAALMGDESAARRHYEDALLLEQRTGSRPWLAVTQIAYGGLLLRSRRPADVMRGTQLVASGRAIAQELGMEPALQQAVAASAPASRPGSECLVFRQSGDAWEIAFRRQSATVPHRVGMTYLRCLLERPGVPVAALELASLGGNAMLIEHHGGPAIDRKAMADVQRRITEIDADIAACGRRNAVVSADLLHERAECGAYVAVRGTQIVSAADRARSGVTKAIGRALKAIRSVHEGLAHHLERHVETGRFCVYVPDLADPVTVEF